MSQWKIAYENEGAEGLPINDKGGTGFLTESQRFEIFFPLKDKPHDRVEE